MKKFVFATILLAGFVTAAIARDDDTDSGVSYEIEIEKSIMVPMRDGVMLSTDLYMPKGADGDLGTILMRDPYDKNVATSAGHEYRFELLMSFVRRGFVVAIQDIRGRFESEGRYLPGKSNRDDGYDTVTWLTDQPWSNDRLATFGCSYTGDTQVILATARHPKHVAAAPMASTTGYYAHGRPWVSFDGGAFELAQTAGWFSRSGPEVFYGPPAWVDRQEWFRSDAAKLYRKSAGRENDTAYFPFISTLPIVDILKKSDSPPTQYENFVSSNPEGPYFKDLEWANQTDQFDTPMLIVDAWYDYGPAESLEFWNLAKKNSISKKSRDNQYVIIAPTKHCAYINGDGSEQLIVGERELGDARLDYRGMLYRWYDYWLRDGDDSITDMPKVQYYLMGKNEWRSSDTWPLADTSYRKFYLHSGGNANSRFGDGTISLQTPAEEPADHFFYDPATPVPSLGGQACCTGTDKGAGSYDQSVNEMRDDVLVFTSEVLDQGVDVTGPLEVVLYVSSSAKDTDFTAKLIDVYPDGRAFNVQEGALRMRYREGFSKKVWMEDDEVYEARLNLHATANYFGPGHRIRLEVSSSNFPRWDRNLNTGGNNFDETEWVIAKNVVHHSAQYPSHLVLPLIDAAGGGKPQPSQLAHTYSIVARDEETGELGVAVQTHYFGVGSRVVWAEPGVGAVATQSFIEPAYGPKGLALMRSGKNAAEALENLLSDDAGADGRQVGMVDANGNVANHTGQNSIAEFCDIAGAGFTVQANLMWKSTVCEAMSKAYKSAAGDLAERMMIALEAAEGAGGDIRGKQSAAMLVVNSDASKPSWDGRVFDLRIEDHAEPLVELRRLLTVARAYRLMSVGDEYMTRSDLDNAKASYGSASALQPDNHELIFWHALTLAAAGQVDDSLPLFDRAFKLWPRWRELVQRMPASGLLPDDPLMMERITSLE
jgi:putative CocE/NonD family hydrolase